jgi:hypothetical protein
VVAANTWLGPVMDGKSPTMASRTAIAATGTILTMRERVMAS